MSVLNPAELRRIVLNFRVQELKSLLQEFRLNRYGAKADLQSRAITYLDSKINDSALAKKIVELHEQRHGTAFDRNSIASIDSNSNGTDSNPDMSLLLTSNNISLPNYFSMPMAADFAENNKSSASADTTDDATKFLQPNTLKITFKPIPFFEKICDVMKPQLLEKHSNLRYQEVPYPFKLTSFQASRISLNRDLPNPNSNPFRIQIRFTQIGSPSTEHDDLWPNNLSVKVNNKIVPVPSICPINKTTGEARKNSRPIDITQFVKLSPITQNNVVISYVAEYHVGNPLQFCFTVQLVKKLEASELVERLVSNGSSDPTETQNMVVEKLRNDDESEILSSTLKCKLACPLGKMRITIPVRGKLCKHIQCFDAMLYLKMNEKKSTWICPICDQKTEYHHLFIDGLFSEILSKSNYECEEVEFLADGNWRKLETSKKTVRLSEERVAKKRKISCDVITLDSDEESSPQEEGCEIATIHSPFKPPRSTKSPTYIVSNPSSSFEPEIIALD